MESEPLPRKLAAILDLITATVERYGGSVMRYVGDVVLHNGRETASGNARSYLNPSFNAL